MVQELEKFEHVSEPRDRCSTTPDTESSSLFRLSNRTRLPLPAHRAANQVGPSPTMFFASESCSEVRTHVYFLLFYQSKCVRDITVLLVPP